MRKLFVGAPYNVQHSTITKENAEEKLCDDIRAKIIGSSFVESKHSIIEGTDLIYIGGFYYEKGVLEEEDAMEKCKLTVNNELNEINEADVIVLIFNKYSAIATVTELLYSSVKNKNTVVFYKTNIAGFSIEKEYWFPFLTSLKMRRSSNCVIIPFEDESEVISYIKEKL